MSPRVTATVGLALAIVVALASLVTMVVVVAAGDRDPIVAVIEVATWTTATIWLPVVAWRHYRRVSPRR